jgi:hypothetical protein
VTAPDRAAASPPALLLAALVLPVGGWVPGGPFPVAPGAYLVVALGVGLLVVTTFLVRGRALDALGLGIALAPFAVFGLLERPAAPVGTPSVRAVVEGLRPACPVATERVPPLAIGDGPWRVPATAGPLPRRGPVVLVLGDAGDAVPARTTEATFVTTRGTPVGTAVEAALDAGDALVLDAFDAVVVLPGAEAGSPAGSRTRADALVAFVRRGGLLVGPAPGRDWPETIGRRLGSAGQSGESGAAGARRLGIGRVVRAASESEVVDVLAAAAWVPEVATVFDRADEAPPAPRAFAPWRDEPGGRRGAALLLAVYALLLAVLDRVLPAGGARALALLGPAAAVVAGVVWSSPGDPGALAEGVVLDLGGAGGRRVEAVWISAGPAGWRGHVRWSGGGCVRLLGGGLDTEGRVVVAPRRSAWVVRETAARGVPDEGDRPDPAGGALEPLVRGTLDGGTVRHGTGAALPVTLEGLPAPRVRSLLVRG